MCDPVTLAIAGAQLGFSYYQMDQQQEAAADAAEASYENSKKQYANEAAAASREAADASSQAQAQKNDRIRQFRSELGALQVAQSEQGISGRSATLQARSRGGLAGVDIGRIERNNRNQLSNIQERLRQAGETTALNYKNAQRQARNASKQAQMQFISSGLQIAGDAYSQHKQQQLAQNPG